jgi:hypothetical protein
MATAEPAAAPGYVCPFCGTDCSPIAGEPCEHLFVIDGENGWRFTPTARRLFDAAADKGPALFRDLLYQDSLEIFVFSEAPTATVAAFDAAIARGR